MTAQARSLLPRPRSRPIPVRRALAGVPVDPDDLAAARALASNPNWASSRLIPRIAPGQSAADVHPAGAGFNLVRLHPDRPCPTIPKTMNGSIYAGLLAPHDDRFCTIAELRRLASFPDDFRFAGGFTDAWARIGNAVPPRLMEAIAMHLREVAPLGGAPTVISTFAGCGGSSLGYRMAGYRELLAVEWDANAAETFRLNFPDVAIYEGDIAALSVEECLRLAGIALGELDVLDGSPPCQGFSTAGNRQLDDPRNQLFREYTRLLRGLRPKAFVMENVSGMVKGKMKLLFAEILRELKACGYVVECRLLNAMYFGVPQSRERLIFVGVREDLRLAPSFPAPQTRPITFREACSDLDEDGPGDRPLHRLVAAYAPYHPGGYNTDEALWKRINPGFGGHFNLKWIAWDRICGTIPRMETTVTGMVHPRRTRYLSLAELRRCGSFPDDFQFLSLADAVKRIGNAVPPQMMRAVAAHIRSEILDKIAPVTSPQDGASSFAIGEAADD